MCCKSYIWRKLVEIFSFFFEEIEKKIRQRKSSKGFRSSFEFRLSPFQTLIGVSGAEFGGFVAKIEASGIKIGPLRPGFRALGSISGHLGPRLVAQGLRLVAIGPRLEALRQRSGVPGPVVGA